MLAMHMLPAGLAPAATLIGVQSLASADWLIETEAVARESHSVRAR